MMAILQAAPILPQADDHQACIRWNQEWCKTDEAEQAEAAAARVEAAPAGTVPAEAMS